MAKQAKITKTTNCVWIDAPYNSELISEIKALPGREYNPDFKVWSVPAEHEEKVRLIVRKYFQIRGEESTIEYSNVRLIVRGKASGKRTYLGNVTVDDHDIISPWGDVRRNDDTFEVISEKGGFTYGDSNHAWEVEYDLILKVRKGAKFHTTGRADYWGDFEIVKDVVEA